MAYRIFDSELKILELLWDGGELTAKEIAALCAAQVGWSKTTTYTVLKKCVEKGLIAQRAGFSMHGACDAAAGAAAGDAGFD